MIGIVKMLVPLAIAVMLRKNLHKYKFSAGNLSDVQYKADGEEYSRTGNGNQ
jgi:hypothetical protein